MRLARKLFLFAAAIAMFAIAAPAANAIEVTDEASGNHCSEVSTDEGQENAMHVVSGANCEVHATTEDETTANLAGHWEDTGEVTFSRCENEFNARLHESGNGLIYNQILTEPDPPAVCGLAPCDEANEAKIPWPANLMEFGAFEALQVTFCTRLSTTEPGDQGNPCTVFIPLDVGPDHEYEFTTIAPGPTLPHSTGAPLQSRCSQNAAVSLTGHWEVTGTPVEIAH
jgi:hypothetical protein